MYVQLPSTYIFNTLYIDSCQHTQSTDGCPVNTNRRFVFWLHNNTTCNLKHITTISLKQAHTIQTAQIQTPNENKGIRFNDHIPPSSVYIHNPQQVSLIIFLLFRCTYFITLLQLNYGNAWWSKMTKRTNRGKYTENSNMWQKIIGLKNFRLHMSKT